jgi:hypothetical protein
MPVLKHEVLYLYLSTWHACTETRGTIPLPVYLVCLYWDTRYYTSTCLPGMPVLRHEVLYLYLNTGCLDCVKRDVPRVPGLTHEVAQQNWHQNIVHGDQAIGQADLQ